MALAYDATRVTRDVDSLFVPHGVVLEEARNVAQELGLPPWWLNEQASVYISGKDDPGKRRVFDHPGLRVTAASPRHIFAMKALAARTRDIDDLRLLAEMIGVDSAATAVQICAEFFPEEDIPARSAAVLKSSSADLRTLEPYPAGRPVQEQADAGQRCPGLIPPLHRGSLMPGVPPVFQPGFTPLVAGSALHCALRSLAGEGWQCGTNQLLAQVAQGLATGAVTAKALVSAGAFGRGAGATGRALAGDVPVTADTAAAGALASSGPDIAAIQMRAGRPQ